MRRHLLPLPLRRPLAGLLVCALLLTQALGALHRSLHADGPPIAHAEHAEHAEHAHTEHTHGVLEALFAQHHNWGDCRIFDQLSHAEGVGFAFFDPGTMTPAQLPAPALRASRVAAQAAGYLARGPPMTG
jgi:hypothetical protein